MQLDPQWRREFPDRRLGRFQWEVASDTWYWSPQIYTLHGYEPSSVVPDFDLVVGHKDVPDRRRAERIMSYAAQVCDLRFENLHHIVDTRGCRREVLSVGEMIAGPTGKSAGNIMRGYMVDLTDNRATGIEAVRASPAVRGPDGLKRVLTRREMDVLELVAAGSTNAEIGRALFLSVNTVKTHVGTAFRKIGVCSRPQAMVWLQNRR